MKAKDFGHFLRSVSDVALLFGTPRDTDSWLALVTFFDANPNLNVSALCTKLEAAIPAHHAGDLVDGVIVKIEGAQHSMGIFLGKKPADDLKLLFKALLPHKSHSLAAVLAAAATPSQPQKKKVGSSLSSVTASELVDSYCRKLESTFGDKTAFERTFRDLQNDRSVTAAVAKKIAKVFAKETATSKEKAFHLIWGRHAAVMESRAKDAATGGRTAA